MRRANLLTALCSASLLVASCTIPTSDSADDPTNPLANPLSLVGSDPAEGARGVSLLPDVVLTFDGFPDPDSVASFGPLSLRSGVNSYDYLARVDLAGRAIILRPRTPLMPGAGYTVLITPAVRSLDGRSVAGNKLVHFTTAAAGSSPANNRHDPTPRTLTADVQPLFARSCALGSCHDASTHAGALDLSSVDASHGSLVGVPSVQVELWRVSPGDPAQSYLLRKLLGTPRIGGAVMPLGNRWLDEDIRTVSDWIATGAQP